MLGEKDRDLAVVRTGRSAADPDRRSRREERVEVALVVVADARREDARLEIGRGNEGALQLRDRVEERALAGARRVEAVPRRREPGQRPLFDGLDLAAQPRERTLSERAQHAGVDPLRPGSAWTELALDDRASVGELAQRFQHRTRRP